MTEVGAVCLVSVCVMSLNAAVTDLSEVDNNFCSVYIDSVF